ncbi:replication endonuclease [Pseudoalteromonas sp.]|uniref:replication endonuclease n=1 Tax=Pseudoalteromonas sp. TaxID=53249 RepID=UPI0026295D65|nr:replication endonuclease [Pseudoalteromonas sp.]MCP4586905.1 replication endonuclease [Pseudoalteromonas sp.]
MTSIDYSATFTPLKNDTHLPGLPNVSFINAVSLSSNRDIYLLAEAVCKSNTLANETLKSLSCSPFRSVFARIYKEKDKFGNVIKEYRMIDKRIKNARNVRQLLKKLRGYYLDLYTSWNKLIGGSKGKKLYVSVKATHNRRQTILGTQKFLKTKLYIEKNGLMTSYKLEDLVPSDQDRINDIFSDMLVIEKIADDKNLEQVLLTFTALPFLHANPSEGKCSYDGASRLEALKFIQDEVYRVLYKRLHAAKIEIIGFSAPEPHKDGCPHIHAGWFIKPEQLPDLQRAVKKLKKEIAKEYGLNDYQLDIRLKSDLAADKKPAKASSYVLKYVMKSFSDPSTSAWYSRDNGGEIRRCNRLGLGGFKTKFNFVYKLRKELVKHSDKNIRDLGEMLCARKKELMLSDKKLNFLTVYNELFECIYKTAINEFDEKVKYFDSVIFTNENGKKISIEDNKNVYFAKDLDNLLLSEFDQNIFDGNTDLTINICYSRENLDKKITFDESETPFFSDDCEDLDNYVKKYPEDSIDESQIPENLEDLFPQ